jgi:hypothetical protein
MRSLWEALKLLFIMAVVLMFFGFIAHIAWTLLAIGWSLL